MLSLELRYKKPFKSLQLARIQISVDFASYVATHSNPNPIFRISPHEAALKHALHNLQTLSATHPDLAFIAYPLDHSLLQLFSPKSNVPKLFKILLAQQHELGVCLSGDLKSHVSLAPLSSEELVQACVQDIIWALVVEPQNGWCSHFPVSHTNNSGSYVEEGEGAVVTLLAHNPMHVGFPLPCTASTTTTKITTPTMKSATPMIHIYPSECQVDVNSNTLQLVLQPTTVTYRHLPCTPPGSTMVTPGTLCRVLPTGTPGIIERIRTVSAQDMELLCSAWGRAGWSVPSTLTQTHGVSNDECSRVVVDVRFEEDEDAPATPFPACAVLSFQGFYPVDDERVGGTGMVTALTKFRHDLLETKNSRVFYSATGGGQELEVHIKKAYCLVSDGGRDHGRQGGSGGGGGSGEKKVGGFMPASTASITHEMNNKWSEYSKNPIELSCLFRSAADGAHQHTGTSAAAAATATREKKPHARATPQLLEYLKKIEEEEAESSPSAVQTNARPVLQIQATSSLPSTTVGKATQTKTNRSPAAALAFLMKKKPVATSTTSRLGNDTKIPAAKKQKMARASDNAAAAAKETKKGKAGQQQVEIDVTSLNVPSLAASNALNTLTIPQLKAFCRSVKVPVGGKKADLEMRIKQHLGISPVSVVEATATTAIAEQ